jgi:hypothetical protein
VFSELGDCRQNLPPGFCGFGYNCWESCGGIFLGHDLHRETLPLMHCHNEASIEFLLLCIAGAKTSESVYGGGEVVREHRLVTA